MAGESELSVRAYGDRGPLVVLVHGGPGAPGYLVGPARELATLCRVLEPTQRRSGGERLSVARHVADLARLLAARGDGRRAVLVGHSWGAMLALAYAAAHPASVAGLGLVGCGTFDPDSRRRCHEIRERRMTPEVRRRLELIERRAASPDDRLCRVAELYLSVDSVDLLPGWEMRFESCDARGYSESWQDMLRLQEEGLYPAAFSAITAPVLMLHGDADPHPGAMIRDSLKPFLAELDYRELDRCGHYPWLEAAARREFYAQLREWIESLEVEPS